MGNTPPISCCELAPTPPLHRAAETANYIFLISSLDKTLNLPKLTNFIKPQTHKLANLATQKLKLLFFILQHHSNFHSVLAKIKVQKQAKCYYFLLFKSSNMSVFKKKTCILHHLAFLVWLTARNSSSPITRFQPLKSHFLTKTSSFRDTFQCLKNSLFIPLRRIFMLFALHFVLRLAPFYLAFCTKTHCILHQNALRFAPYCTTFSTKQPQNGCKWRFFIINIHLASIYNYPPFAPKPTFARIDFLRQGERLVNRKGTHNVKFNTEQFTNVRGLSCLLNKTKLEWTSFPPTNTVAVVKQ